jgi:hypothetical protein
MRDPRYPFLEKYRSGETDRSDGFNPVTHLRASQLWAYGGWALVAVVAIVLLTVFGCIVGLPW